MIVEEHKTVKISQRVNYICPYCNQRVYPNMEGAQWVKTSGDSVKKYFHEACYRTRGI